MSITNTSTVSVTHDAGRFVRRAGLWCIVGGAIAAVGATVTATIPSSVPASDLSYPYSPTVFRVTEVIWTVSHVLTFVGTLGLARSGAVGTSRAGQIGVRIALVGMALIAVIELAFAFFATETVEATPAVVLDSAIGMATILAAVGFVIAGSATLRTRRWHGWRRFTPLLCGLFVLVAFLPVIAIQPDLFLWPVAGWSACFVLLGLALYRQAQDDAASVATKRAGL